MGNRRYSLAERVIYHAKVGVNIFVFYRNVPICTIFILSCLQQHCISCRSLQATNTTTVNQLLLHIFCFILGISADLMSRLITRGSSTAANHYPCNKVVSSNQTNSLIYYFTILRPGYQKSHLGPTVGSQATIFKTSPGIIINCTTITRSWTSSFW